MLSPKHKKRLFWALSVIVLAAAVVGTLLFTLKENVQLYFTPHAIAEGKAPLNRPIRLGGLVVPGSVKRGEGLDLSFVLADGSSEVTVLYSGVLPDLFKEGQGIVAMGTLSSPDQLQAVQVLAKHDENYMPKGLKQNGP